MNMLEKLKFKLCPSPLGVFLIWMKIKSVENIRTSVSVPSRGLFNLNEQLILKVGEMCPSPLGVFLIWI